jgi:seryl-tRNA synthetase
MLDARHVTEHFDPVRSALGRRSAQAAAAIDRLSEPAALRRALIAKVEGLKAQRNAANDAMAKLAKSGDRAAFEAQRNQLRELADQIRHLEAELQTVEAQLEEQLLAVPNTPHESVPDGRGSEDNPERRRFGARPEFDFEPRPHWEIGSDLGILDFERAAKLSGARFAVLWGAGARLERALITFMLDLHTREHGYAEVYPPYLVKAEALRGTGQLPKFEEDLFKTLRSGTEDTSPLYLIPTAEVPVTNLHADEILETANLPLAYVAFTPCFRSEAGSYGKDVRGLIRQHQFDKVELVRFVEPEQGLAELERLVGHAEAVLERLGLHYRVVELCAADLGFSASKTYDLEVWLPSQNQYREISSCSWFTDYQARRAKIRFRKAKGKPQLVHTLNGSGLAVGRTLIAILEQYQQRDGSVLVPPALRPYLGVERLTKDNARP